MERPGIGSGKVTLSSWVIPTISVVLIASVISFALVFFRNTSATSSIRSEAEKVVLVVEMAESIQKEADLIARQFATTPLSPGLPDEHLHEEEHLHNAEPSESPTSSDPMTTLADHHQDLLSARHSFDAATDELAPLVNDEQRGALDRLIDLHNSYVASFAQLDVEAHADGSAMAAYHSTTQVIEADLRRSLRSFERLTATELNSAIGDVRKNEFVLGLAVPVTLLAGVSSSLILVRIARYRREALESLVKAKDRFLGSVSHELRTPLTGILGFADILKSQADELSSEEKSHIVRVIVEQSREVSALVEDLLVAARAEIGQLTFASVRVNLKAQVSQVVEALDLSGAVDLRGVPADPVSVVGDPLRVRQVIRNLVTNAVRYGSGSITVTISKSGTNGCVEVWSGGAPIDDEQRRAIFEPYHRAHDATGLAGSIGLGLFVARDLARGMGGEVTHDPRDEGNAFTLTLPLHSDTYRPAEAAALATVN